MKNLEQILANEFKSRTGQELHPCEKVVLDDYIEYFYKEDWTLEDLKNCVADFITDCFYTNPDYDPNIDCIDNDEYILADCSHYPMAHRETIPNYMGDKPRFTTIYTYRDERVEKIFE